MPLSSTAFSPFFLFSKKTIFKFWQVVRVNDIRKRWTLKAVLLGTRRRQPHKCAKVIKETLELVLWMLLSVPERFLFVRSLVFQQQFTLQVQAVLSPFLSLALSLSPLVSAVLVKVCNGYWNMHLFIVSGNIKGQWVLSLSLFFGEFVVLILQWFSPAVLLFFFHMFRWFDM